MMEELNKLDNAIENRPVSHKTLDFSIFSN
jgi:hypothetical protein